MTLSNNQVNNVCMNNCGSKACRYLCSDDLDSSKFYCLKLRPIEKAKIDKEIFEFIQDCKKRKLNYRLLSKAIGDNCEGYLLLRNIKQGYDITS